MPAAARRRHIIALGLLEIEAQLQFPPISYWATLVLGYVVIGYFAAVFGAAYLVAIAIRFSRTVANVDTPPLDEAGPPAAPTDAPITETCRIPIAMAEQHPGGSGAERGQGGAPPPARTPREPRRSREEDPCTKTTTK